MKKIAFMMFGLFAAGMLSFTSCTEDTPTPGDIHPTMNFTGSTGYVSGDVTLATSTQFLVGINAFASTESNSPLAKLKVTRILSNKPEVFIDSTLGNVANFQMDISITSNAQAGEENFIFTLTDKAGETRELSFTVTTTAGAGPINTFTMKIMGAQGSTTGSSFASIDGTVYNGPDAKTNAVKVDWLYFYGATNMATLAAPDDPDAATIFTNATYGLQTWSVLNATRFKKITTPVDFDAITDDAEIIALTDTDVTLTKANNLDVDDVIGFVTVTGKRGLILVEAITGTNAGEITISVKVQQ